MQDLRQQTKNGQYSHRLAEPKKIDGNGRPFILHISRENARGFGQCHTKASPKKNSKRYQEWESNPQGVTRWDLNPVRLPASPSWSTCATVPNRTTSSSIVLYLSLLLEVPPRSHLPGEPQEGGNFQEATGSPKAFRPCYSPGQRLSRCGGTSPRSVSRWSAGQQTPLLQQMHHRPSYITPICAEDGNRTHTSFYSRDFKSLTAAVTSLRQKEHSG